MYGLIANMRAAPGQRDALIEILLKGAAKMPGCLSYVVAKDATDINVIWVTEVWNDARSHRASLTLPSVLDAMAQGKRMIESFGKPTETQPVEGYGLTRGGSQ